MKVGLYIPCYNAAETLRFCLEGVFKQSLRPDEVIVVDDGSSDDTAKAASLYPVRIITHAENLGLAAARNTAVKALKTELIASLDSDCIPDPEWLASLSAAFDSPDIAGAGGRIVEGYSSSVFDSWRKAHMRQEWGEERKNPAFLFGANTLLLREAIVSAGLYNTEFRNNYEDVDICRRLREKGYSLVYEPKALAHHYKSDDFHSLLNTYWRWNFPYYQESGYYSDQERFIYKIKDNLGLANRYMEEDLNAERHKLLYLDLLLALHHSWKDFEYFVSQGSRKDTRPPPVSLWLSFLDLNLSYHLHRQRDELPTLLPKSDYFLQNFFAMELLLFRHNQGLFSRELKKALYRDLLLSVYKVQDEHLMEKLLTFNNFLPDWSALLKKRHPHLNMSFLSELSVVFEEWLQRPIFRSNNMAHLIEMAAGRM